MFLCYHSRMKTLLIIFSLFVVTGQSLAHDCFLMAKPFRIKPGGTTRIALHVDETFPGKHVAWNPERVTRFHQWYGRTLLNSIVPEPDADSSGASVTIKQSGTYLFAVDWSQRFIEIEPKQFTKYLQAEGLDHIVKLRKDRKEENKPGRELYSRYLKTLVTVGEGEQNSYRQVVGQSLELLPLADPTMMKAGDTLRVRLLYRGAPVERAKISATYKGAGNKPGVYAQSARTGKDGSVAIRLTHAGPWLIRTVYMLPSESAEADWESWWASMTFDVQ